ncbi:Hvo_1808 family surface protein [Salinibaculum rarum]|uniref:Hvo_1808 family surface protein n=1 Tax=Salinibaculum rarum TaxID=3058903 RepID=UPI00265FF85A|nr:Hvo_1808 family surface protein [Salinibaculum sp. KK48]
MKRTVVATVLLTVLVVLAGCSAFGGQSPADDPGQDQLGWEGGYWYNDSIEVDASDGLSEPELRIVVNRSMARLEQIRGLEFKQSVPVEIINRSEYRQNQPFEANATHSKWNNQVWEALLLVGEDRNISAVFEQAYGSSVLGYYSPSEDRIVIVSNSDEPKINRGTLVHELVHALQDQQFGIGGAPDTQDRQLARNGVVEGEATVLEQRYNEQCRENWSCVESFPSGSGGGSVDPGVITVITYPYVVGPSFVEAIEQRGGREAVNDLYGEYPRSTEQVSNPSLYPDEEPINVTVLDRSNGEWTRFNHDPVADTAGQASIQVMFQMNGDASGGYTGPVSDGWGGDTIVPYQNGDQYGYVWELAWDSREDAREFHTAYRDVLAGHDARAEGDGVYVVPESNTFGDAFRVTRDGTRVRIVNAPTVDALDEIHSR